MKVGDFVAQEVSQIVGVLICVFDPIVRGLASPTHDTEFVFLRFKCETVNDVSPPVNKFGDASLSVFSWPVNVLVATQSTSNVDQADELLSQGDVDGAPAIARVLILFLLWLDFFCNHDRASADFLQLRASYCVKVVGW